MFLAVDIGNSNITIGCFFDGKMFVRKSVSLDEYCYDNKLVFDIPEIKEVNRVVIASVVPKIEEMLVRDFVFNLNVKPEIFGKDIRIDLEHKYEKISELGVDRILNVKGALALYSSPFLVIDFGSAITFDFVNSDGIFEGGLIVPGVKTSLDGLVKKTALLPDIKKVSMPQYFIGRNTKNCMNSGLFYGAVALTDGLINKFKCELDENLTCILTGGMASLFYDSISHKTVFDEDLILKSIYILASK